jgi:hypothetical protein
LLAIQNRRALADAVESEQREIAMNAVRAVPKLTLGAMAVVGVMLSASSTLADGIAFKGRDWTSLIPAVENEQIAAIHHGDGVQRMIIAISFDAEQDEQGLWIFPVPGTPENTFVDIQDRFPQFAGYDPRQKAAERISTIMIATRAWEIFPLLLEGLFFLPTLGRGGDISVHQEVEKWGVRAEVVTAKSVESLAEHLQEAGTGVNPDHLNTLEPYLSEEYVLVIAWIRSFEDLKEWFPEHGHGHRPSAGRMPSLYVEFATAKPFYPFRPTSCYGEQKIRLRLHIIGFVELETAPHIASELHAYHYQQEELLVEDLGPFAEGLNSRDLPYTTIWGSVVAESLTDDLTFAPVEPPKMKYAEAVRTVLGIRPVFLVFIALLIGFSYLSGGLAGLLVVRRWATPAWLGCWNVLTLAGLSIALRYNNLTGEPGGTDPRLRRRYLLAFFAAYVIISVVLHAALLAPLFQND